MFAGRSTLRAKETAPVKVDPVLQAYVQRYEGGGNSSSAGKGTEAAKKKRKKKKPGASAVGGIRILDESVSGFATAPAAAHDGDDDYDDDGYGAPWSHFLTESSSSRALTILITRSICLL